VVFELQPPRTRRRGLAVWGLLLFLGLQVGGFAAGMKIAAAALSPANEPAAVGLRYVEGQCRLVVTVDGKAGLGDIVPCEQPHTAETVAVVQATSAEFANLRGHERVFCESRALDYLVDWWVMPPGSTITWQVRTDGDRAVGLDCFVLTGRPVSESVRQFPEGLDPDEASFLYYANAAEAVRAEFADTSAAGLRAAAPPMIGQLQATRSGLRNTAWESYHAAPIDRLIRDLDKAIAAWQAVQQAGSDAEVLAAGQKAMDAYGPAQLAAARDGIGLPAEQGTRFGG
jgi:hypothetical protein